MTGTVVAVAARVRELEGLLDRLSVGLWPASGAIAPLSDRTPGATGVRPSGVAGGPVVPIPGPADGPPPGASVGQPGSSAPFAVLLRDAAGGLGAAPVSMFGRGAAGPVVEPVPGGRISQRYAADPNGGGGHDGLDIAAPVGTAVRAVAAGIVRFAGRVGDGAVVVRIEHGDGSEAVYGHLEPGLEVRVGDRVAAGETIGRIGLTGRTTGPHLHLEFWFAGRTVDPEPILRAGVLPGPIPGAAAGEPAGAALRRFDLVASTIPYADAIRAAAVGAGIDPLLLAALVRTESGFRPEAVSRAGAMGLTQLMPATARSLGVSDPFDPAANLEGGARYLAGNLRLFGRVDLALAAYQAGKAAVRAAGGIPESPTTRAYVARVLETWASYLSAAEERA